MWYSDINMVAIAELHWAALDTICTALAEPLVALGGKPVYLKVSILTNWSSECMMQTF